MIKDVYVITGGSEVLGKATAELVGTKGTLLLVDKSEKRLAQTKEQLGAKGITDVHYESVDITSKEAVQRLADKAAELGRLKGLVHAPGQSYVSDLKRGATGNVIGMGHLLEAFLPLAVSGTSAVMISSMSAYMVPKNGQYMDVLKQQLADRLSETLEQFTQGDAGAANNMSKLAIHLIVEDQAWAWGEKGARLNSVSHGMTNTQLGRQEAFQPGQMKALLDHTPLRREGKPSEIASAIDFLLSDAASYITGIDLRVDGGTIANFPRMKVSML